MTLIHTLESWTARPPSPTFDVSLLTNRESIVAIEPTWEKLLDVTDNLDVTFQTPAWFDHVRSTRPTAVLVHHASRGGVDGVIPIVKDVETLEFVAARYMVGRVDVHAAHILGSLPLLPEDLDVFDHSLAAIDAWADDCDCISLPVVPRESFTWRYLQTSDFVRDRYRTYVPLDPGAGHVHVIDLPATFDRYVADLGAKRRANFKRKINVLVKNGKPPLLREFSAPADVPAFLEVARGIAQKTWQRAMGVDHFCPTVDWTKKLTDLAERGVWRSFVLYCGDTPAAFGLGYQDRGVFHFRSTGFDSELASLSPGTVLMYMMLRDVLATRAPRRLCFCFGDAAYKRNFSNARKETVRVLLFRRTPRNDLLCYAHGGFRALVRTTKAALTRVSPERFAAAFDPQ